jgi:2-methylisocitrate lyase-like PEP mutase family enzyme
LINARIDAFLNALDKRPQADLLDEGLRRARAYVQAEVDCLYPITLWERDALASFVAEVGGHVNILATPRAPSIAELSRLGVARVSMAALLYRGSDGVGGKRVTSLAQEVREAAGTLGRPLE